VSEGQLVISSVLVALGQALNVTSALASFGGFDAVLVNNREVKKREDGLPANGFVRWLANDTTQLRERQLQSRLARKGEPDGSAPFTNPDMQKLGERFDFTVQDLEQNRQGVMSERQKQRSRSWGSKTLGIAAKTGAVLGGFLGSILLISTRDLSGSLVVAAVVFGISLPFGLLMRWILHLRPARKGRVKSGTGEISHYVGHKGAQMTAVTHGRFGLGRNWGRGVDDIELFAPMPFVTVNYLPGLGITTVLSIEPAEPPT